MTDICSVTHGVAVHHEWLPPQAQMHNALVELLALLALMGVHARDLSDMPEDAQDPFQAIGRPSVLGRPLARAFLHMTALPNWSARDKIASANLARQITPPTTMVFVEAQWSSFTCIFSSSMQKTP